VTFDPVTHGLIICKPHVAIEIHGLMLATDSKTTNLGLSCGFAFHFGFITTVINITSVSCN